MADMDEKAIAEQRRHAGQLKKDVDNGVFPFGELMFHERQTLAVALETYSALPPLRAREEIARDCEIYLSNYRRAVAQARDILARAEAAETVAAEALSRTAGQEWRDISAVNVAECDENHPVLIGWWSRSFSPHETREWQWVQAYWGGEEWNAGEYEIDHCNPTHYLQPQLLPLPAPPVAEPKETP